MRKLKLKKLSLITILIMLISFQTIAQNKMSFIKVEGNKFVDENGEVFVFRGVSSSDPDKLEKAGKWNDEYFSVLSKWNMNVVRFPVHPAAWRSRRAENYLKLLDEGIALAEKYNLYVIIDWHSSGNLHTELFFKPMYNTTKTETFRFWQIISERYKNNPTVAFYELFNEPTINGGKLGKVTWDEHKELMEEIIGVIYAVDKNVIPLVAGYNWAYDLTPVKLNPIAYPGIAYVTHPYPQKREQPWEDKWEKDWGFAADTYPIVATELGFMSADGPGAHIPVIADETYGEKIVNYFNKKGISWVAWVFDPEWSPQMIQSWNYEPTMQGKFFKKKYEELNK